MGERKAVNKYYPPDWTPEQGSLDRYHGQHPLRERARKLGQGILIIRFEMPYNIWCGGCGNHIGMGVRYNAEKKKVGNYYTTPIYRFRMKCHLCDNHFEIETDPKNCDYVIVNGARRKEERWEPSATETVELTDREDAKKMAADPMFKLEHGVKDEQKSKAVQPTLGQLQEVQSIWKDDYAANQLLRKKFRETKHELKAQEMKDSELQQRASLDVPLVPERLEDIDLARKIRYHGEGFDEHRRKRRFEVNSRPMFDSKKKSDEKREKVKQLLGKRKQMQFNSFSSPATSKSELIKLGIKVRRNRSRNSEGSEDCSVKERVNKDPTTEEPANKDPTTEDPVIEAYTINDTAIDEGIAWTAVNLKGALAPSGLDKPAHSRPDTNSADVPDIRIFTVPEVTSRCENYENPASFLRKRKESGNEAQVDCLAKQRKDLKHNECSQDASDNVRVNNSSSVGFLVCCDYTDSSDSSDDTS